MAFLKELQKTTQHLRKRRLPHDESAPILRTEKLSLGYESGPALLDVSFYLEKGSRLAVVGPNGAGKSTLLKIIAGVLEPTQGKVYIYGNEPVGHICVAYVPQRSQVDWSFPATVADVVMMGRVGQMGLFRNPSTKDWAHVSEILETVGLGGFAHRQISQLSGGQQQRMFIARSIAQEAELMLMDEPLTGLDVKSQEDIFQILDRLQAEGVTVLISLHDLQLAAQRFDQVMLLNKRVIKIGLPEQTLSAENLITAYGGKMQMVSTPEGDIPVVDSCCGGDEHNHD
jgi:manganese/iron transport system ATP-binding protein